MRGKHLVFTIVPIVILAASPYIIIYLICNCIIRISTTLELDVNINQGTTFFQYNKIQNLFRDNC